MSDRLAVHGGAPLIDHEFAPYRSYGAEEAAAARAVVDSGVLSAYVGAPGEYFLGGPRVRAFEDAWSAWFGAGHSVAVNSATSGLVAAVGALGVEPGAEVIVTPWTMSATAMAIVAWSAIPVFADIETRTFGLEPEAVEGLITERTQAIVVADIFGHGARLDEVMALARRHGLAVVEDAAQAPGALYRGRRVGTIADIGVFSLNYHKHIHTGEGGMCVTDDPVLAERLRMIRNHAESSAGERPREELHNLVGFNFRLGEIEAAMGAEQLRKLEHLAADRERVGRRLTEALETLEGLTPPVVEDDCTHVYYLYGMQIDPGALGVGRDRLLEALRAEGVPELFAGYVNVHRLRMFEERIAFGRSGHPFTLADPSVRYGTGTCPVAERLQDETLINLETCTRAFTDDEVDLVAAAFHKVWARLDELR